ncbi:MAG: hypothetical protein JWO89_2920 [Verrucomicrobiaceae bacterium]|nr:hypothetical protein [Verrucomicrobiaceae bacterium]
MNRLKRVLKARATAMAMPAPNRVKLTHRAVLPRGKREVTMGCNDDRFFTAVYILPFNASRAVKARQSSRQFRVWK